MKPAGLTKPSLWLLLSLAQAREAPSKDPIHVLSAALDAHQTHRKTNGRWQRCGSSYGRTPGTKYGVFWCALELLLAREQNSWTVPSPGGGASALVVCQHSDTKIWIQANPANWTSSTSSETSHTLLASDVGNVVRQGAEMCCGGGGGGVRGKDAEDTWGDPCGGWGYVGTTPGGMQIIITANNGDDPEPVPCNELPVSSCP